MRQRETSLAARMTSTSHAGVSLDMMSRTGCRQNNSSDLRPTHDAMANSLLLERLRAEFLEMPGLRLTPEQVQRLCGIEPRECQSLLDALVNAKFLCATSKGHYTRLTDGDTRRSHLPKTALSADTRLSKAS